MGDVCVFCTVQGFCRFLGLFTIQVFMYVYGCLDWFSIRGSCLSLSLIGNHIQAAIFFGDFVGYCLCLCVVACVCTSIIIASRSVCCFISFVKCSSSLLKSMYSNHAALWSPPYNERDSLVGAIDLSNPLVQHAEKGIQKIYSFQQVKIRFYSNLKYPKM